MGDKERKWREKPFQMVQNGKFWVPPSQFPREVREKRERERSRSGSRGRSGRSSRRRSRSRSPRRDRDRGRRRRSFSRSSSRSRSRSSSRSRSRRRSRSLSSSEEREREKRRRRRAENQSPNSAKRRKNDEKYMTGQQLYKARVKERGLDRTSMLTDEEYDDFSEMLRSISLDRQKIKEAMGFALDKAEASEEVVTLLKESLLVKETPPPIKVARLYVMSDILHNSSAPVKNASSYRFLFQNNLPVVFHELNRVFRGIEGRMMAKGMEERVLRVLKVWEEWSVFSPLYLTGLEATFMRKNEEEHLPEEGKEEEYDREELTRKCRQAGLVATGSRREMLGRLNHLNEYAKQKAVGILPTEGERTEEGGAQTAGTAESKKEEEDVDGEPLEDVDGEPLEEGGEDIDGEPMEGEDVDGEPLEEDVDGEPIDGEPL